MEPEPTKQIVVKAIPVELWRQVKIHAAENELTIQATVTKALEQFLKQTA